MAYDEDLADRIRDALGHWDDDGSQALRTESDGGEHARDGGDHRGLDDPEAGPAEDERQAVSEALADEDVEAAGENCTRDTVQPGTIPRYLWLVYT